MSSDSSDDEAVASAMIVIATLARERKEKKRKKRSFWVKPWLQRRKAHGTYETLIRDLREEDQHDYNNYFRMDPEEFDELFSLIEHNITKRDTNMREAIPAKIKLAITLRFLATGESYQSLQYQLYPSSYQKFVSTFSYR